MGNQRAMRRMAGFSCFMGILLGLVACQPHVEVPQPAPEKLDIEKVLVVRFHDMSAVYGAGQSARCTICGHAFVTGEVAAGAVEKLTDELMAQLNAREDLTPIPPGQARGVLAGYFEKNLEIEAEREILVEAGTKLGADAVMVGHIYRYEERLGGAYSVSKPAAVTFGLNLIRVPDGMVLWSGAYSEIQQSLTENLLQMGTFFGRGGKWLTADELAHYGLAKVLGTLN